MPIKLRSYSKTKPKVRVSFDDDEDEYDAKVSAKVRGKTREPLVDTKELRSKIKQHDKSAPEKDHIAANANASLFEKRLTAIRNANDKHNYGEQAILVAYKAMYDMIAELIPIAEMNYRVNKIDKSAYALNTYLNQLREIANDMRSVNNYTEQVTHILEMTRGIFSQIATSLVEEIYDVKVPLRDMVRDDQRIKVDEALDRVIKGHAKYLQESLKGFTDSLTDLLLEKPETKPAKIAGKQ